MVLITGLLTAIAFFTGFTFGELMNVDENISITEIVTDYFNNEIDYETNFSNIETYYNLDLDTAITTDVILKTPVTAFVEPTSYKPMMTYEDINFPSEPKTVEDFEKVFLYMVNQEVLEVELQYSDTYNKIFGDDGESKNNNYVTAFHNVTEKYPELFSNIRRYQYEIQNIGSSSTLDIKISNKRLDDVTVLSQEQYFQKSAAQINNALHEKNYITDNMTQKEIAKELFTYVSLTLEYDTLRRRESFTGYGAVKNQKAVCQAYTALYNYLLKLNGIECIGQQGEMLDDGEGHIWTVAILDGETCYIDVTFGDTANYKEDYPNYEYFDISKEDLSKDRTGVE